MRTYGVNSGRHTNLQMEAPGNHLMTADGFDLSQKFSAAPLGGNSSIHKI